MTIDPHLHIKTSLRDILDDRDPGACLASIVSCLATRHVGDHQRNQRRVRFLPKQNGGGGNSCELWKFQCKKLGLGQWLNFQHFWDYVFSEKLKFKVLLQGPLAKWEKSRWGFISGSWWISNWKNAWISIGWSKSLGKWLEITKDPLNIDPATTYKLGWSSK